MRLFTAASFFALAFFLPSSAFAVDKLQDVLCILGKLVAQATPIVAGLALLAFFWGLAMYLFSLSAGEGSAAHSTYGMPASPQNKQKGTTIMIYGIIALFVMVSIWGIISILNVTFGLTPGGQIVGPTIGGVKAAQLSDTYICPK